MIFKRIDHVEIVTDQPDRTEKFYTEVLGFSVKARDRIERSGLGVPIDLVYLDLGGTERRRAGHGDRFRHEWAARNRAGLPDCDEDLPPA